MPKIARELSPLEVGRLKAPGLVFVGGVPGLSMQITPTGARSWILRRGAGKLEFATEPDQSGGAGRGDRQRHA